ncbi:hypothetical protein [Mycobacterium sp. OTB74]|uniref:hypothetical protein n=1 Tax=Mycobacterium sp. OTB74 TaxID=1853452 RepID=UPI0024752F48|nr:hypothetical protein [Mycobacterium sp. OTB74]MDH6245715.1 hypothetical protein [Mycobacterium sp. OTB74]
MAIRNPPVPRSEVSFTPRVRPVHGFNAAWNTQQDEQDAAERAEFTPAALLLADHLDDEALILTSHSGLSCATETAISSRAAQHYMARFHGGCHLFRAA